MRALNMENKIKWFLPFCMFDLREWLVCAEESERDVCWCCGVLTHSVLLRLSAGAVVC
jgi:hypothetical protein